MLPCVPAMPRPYPIDARRPLLARGGQLEIAGVVVGSWGPNYGIGARGRNLMSPQITSVGSVRRYPAMQGMSIRRSVPASKAKKVTTTAPLRDMTKRKVKRTSSSKGEAGGSGKGRSNSDTANSPVTVNQLMRKVSKDELENDAASNGDVPSEAKTNGQFEDTSDSTQEIKCEKPFPTILTKKSAVANGAGNEELDKAQNGPTSAPLSEDMKVLTKNTISALAEMD